MITIVLPLMFEPVSGLLLFFLFFFVCLNILVVSFDDCAFGEGMGSLGIKNKTNILYFLPPGSNTGIGKTTAIDLAKRGARVILACRSKQRGEAALEDVKRVSCILSLININN